MVGRIGPLAKAFDFVATAAPGVREILTVGKLCYEVRERHYDLVVVDAPATGHIVGQLAAPQAINNLVKVGLVRSQTDWMLDILSDPATTGLVAVATPEEMPVNETIELAARVQGRDHRRSCRPSWSTGCCPSCSAGRRRRSSTRSGQPDAAAVGSNGLGGATPTRCSTAARLAVTMRRTRAAHLERLQAGIDPTVPDAATSRTCSPGPTGCGPPARWPQSLGEELGY